MQSVFSHIIQKRFSNVNEDVATDALAYILESSESARDGMAKLLQGIAADLPALRFKTQLAEGTIRPDMWGFKGNQPRVFVENKFWAGLTENQPVSYLKQLCGYPQPTVLLVVAPAAREQTLWRELNHRLASAGIPTTPRAATASVPFSTEVQLGPILALTSWDHLLSVLEHACADDPRARGDLIQLRALCDSADVDAFIPVSRAEVTDQRSPAFILQLSSIVQAAVDLSVTLGALSIGGLRPQASWERIGRYVRIPGDLSKGSAGAWFGVHFGLWKTHGTTPLWLIFEDGDFGLGQEVRFLIEPWASQNGILISRGDHNIAIALDIPSGEEKDAVIRSLARDISGIAVLLEGLLPQKRPEEMWEANGETSS